MSFNLITAAWIARLFVIYGILVLVIPGIVLGRLLEGRTTAQKFVIWVVTGNFFYINLVLILGLFHQTGRLALIGGTVVIPLLILFRRRSNLIPPLQMVWKDGFRLLRGENSLRFTLTKYLRLLRRQIWRWVAPWVRRVKNNWVEWLLFALCSGFLLWYFSVTNHFGPRASDLVVHMLWINEVDQGVIFGEGIYPFGMHAIIYYIHKVFDISTARIILLFGPVQTFYIFTMLLAFLKTVCRYRYTPYITYFAFVMGNWIWPARYSRYYSTLPQEFGMIFILPCAITLIYYFRLRRQEEQEEKRMRRQNLLYTRIDGRFHMKESTLWLGILIMSFSLTLAVHFYDTIVAGCLLGAVAVTYIREIVRLRTFQQLVVAGVLSMTIAVAPMAIAFAGGTPLQGSLYWALSVMGVDTQSLRERDRQRTEEQQEEQEEASLLLQAAALEWEDSAETSQPEQDAATEPAETEEITDELDSSPEAEDAVGEEPADSMETRLRAAAQKESNFLQNLIFNQQETYQLWLASLAIILASIPVLWLLRKWEYSGFLILSMGYILALLLVEVMNTFGLPSLLDENRSSMFFTYTALLPLSLAPDAMLTVLGRVIPWRKPFQLLSLALAVGMAGYTVGSGNLRVKSVGASSLQTDGAALCVFDIMEHYPDQKWTIVSCNEERNMVSPVSWHYETIDFLRSMEGYSREDEMYIPTQYVFFFVEKDVLNYAYGSTFTDLDGHVSREWAAMELPRKSGLTQYSGTNRIILNSRMYYWAQEYQECFPNEMKVYYEDESFVCYFIEQNEYYLNNFAIDYGYNSGD